MRKQVKPLTKQKSQKNKVEKVSKNIYLLGEINDTMCDKIIVNLLEDTKIREVEIVNLFVSSGGGDLHGCFAMIDVFDFQRKVVGYKIKTFGLGQVCSGGFFMFLVGDERILFPKCRVFVHEHVVVDADEEPYTKKMKNMAEDHVLNKIYTQYVADRLGIVYKDANRLLKKDKWLSDKEVTEFNIVTGILDE